MKDLFLNYKESLLMKKKGFDEPCLAWFNNKEWNFGYTCSVELTNDKDIVEELNCSAPLYQQAIQWIIKKIEPKNPFVNITLYADGSGCWVYGSSDTQIIFQNLSDSILEGLKLID